MRDRLSRRMGALPVVILALLSACALGQTAQSQQPPDVVEELMPGGRPDGLVLPKPDEREGVIKQLKNVQAGNPGPRAQRAAFLLATMGVNYERSRDYLLWVFKGCTVPDIARGCDDMTGDYLANLYSHGHSEILRPLLQDGVNSYSASGAEFLGDFFSHLVAKSPGDFLEAVRSFPVETQKKMCFFAGSADGGGMAPADLKRARDQLRGKGVVARRCLEAIERANTQR